MTKVQTTFLKGGYYNVNITNRVSLISFNSIYYDEHKLGNPKYPQSKYMHDKDYPAVQQLDWMERILKENNDNNPSAGECNYIISMHIPPGLNYYSVRS